MAPELEIHYCDELTYREEWFAPAEAAQTLIHRLVTFDDTADEGAFLVAVRNSGATFSCLFEAELKMHRRWFSLLCDPEYQQLLDDEELAVIERYVPHTFDLTADNLADARRQGPAGIQAQLFLRRQGGVHRRPVFDRTAA